MSAYEAEEGTSYLDEVKEEEDVIKMKLSRQVIVSRNSALLITIPLKSEVLVPSMCVVNNKTCLTFPVSIPYICTRIVGDTALTYIINASGEEIFLDKGYHVCSLRLATIVTNSEVIVSPDLVKKSRGEIREGGNAIVRQIRL